MIAALDKVKSFFRGPKPESKAAGKRTAETAEKKEVSGETRKEVRNEIDWMPWMTKSLKGD